MKIATRIEFQMTDSGLIELSREEFEYSGPVALCGGGPDPIQKQQEAAQAKLTNEEADAAQRAEQFKEDQQAKVNPFYGNLMENGPDYTNDALDYESGVNARAYAPAKAALMRSLGTETGLPSGYRDQAISDFDEQRAQGYDNGIMGILADKQAAKERGAAGLLGQAQLADPAALYGGATQGTQTIFNAPRRPGFAGTLGALIGAGAQVGSAYINKPS